MPAFRKYTFGASRKRHALCNMNFFVLNSSPLKKAPQSRTEIPVRTPMWNARKCYRFLDGDLRRFESQEQSGLWHGINPITSKASLTLGVISLRIDHVIPKWNTVCIPVVAPRVAKSTFRRGPSDGNANSTEVQHVAASDRRLLGMVLRSTEAITTARGLRLSADDTCLVMNHKADAQITRSVDILAQ
jgi:hypothetical protein